MVAAGERLPDDGLTPAETIPVVERASDAGYLYLDLDLIHWPNPAVSPDETIQALADEYHMTPAQIVLRWQVQSGISTISRSTTTSHICTNTDIRD